VAADAATPNVCPVALSSPGLDPQYRTCTEAKAHGHGPYVEGRDPEYGWYTDADHDGIVCE
jgi:Excalibur calcium-binding domain